MESAKVVSAAAKVEVDSVDSAEEVEVEVDSAEKMEVKVVVEME